jgi:hypothetical protein
MKNYEIVQMLADLALVAIGVYISVQLSQIIKMLRRQFLWGIASGGSSGGVFRRFSSRCFTETPSGFAVWVWKENAWTLEHDFSEPDFEPEGPPEAPGAFHGERVRTSCKLKCSN